MAADARHRTRTFGYFGRCVVRAAGAKPRRAFAVDREHRQGLLFGLQHRQTCINAGGHVGIEAKLFHARGNCFGYQRRRQIGVRAQQRVGRWIRHAPLATTMLPGITKLANNVGPHIGTPVVQLFFQLIFNDLALFFNHQNFLQASGKLTRQLRFERPHHAHLVQAYAELLASRIVQPQVHQGLTRVVVCLATGNHAKSVVFAFNGVVVQPVSPNIGQRGIPLGVKQALFLRQRRVRPANVHTAGRHVKVDRYFDLYALRINHGAGRRFDNFLNRLHARPHARVAAHGNRVQAQVQYLLHAGREKHRQPAGLENVVALMRSS